jgi:hypothetical protein
MEGTRKFIGPQSSDGQKSSQEQYQKVLILLDRWHFSGKGSLYKSSAERFHQANATLSTGKTPSDDYLSLPRGGSVRENARLFSVSFYSLSIQYPQENSDAQPS